MTLKELEREAKKKEQQKKALREALGRSLQTAENSLLAAILRNFVLSLDTEGGVIKTTLRNFARLQEIDNQYRDQFIERAAPRIMRQLIDGLEEIHDANERYFQDFSTGKRKDFKGLANAIKSEVFLSIGWDWIKRQLQKSGPLYAAATNYAPAQQVKRSAHQAIASGRTSLADLQGTMETLVTNMLAKWYERTMPDVVDQFERTDATKFAQELELTYALYQGGILKTSREFCKVRNAYVFTKDEILKFGTPADKFEGYTNKAAGEFQGKYATGYDPLRDLGGHNCRHFLMWITKELAYQLRPDLNDQPPPKPVDPKPVDPAKTPPALPPGEQPAKAFADMTKEEKLVKYWQDFLKKYDVPGVDPKYLAQMELPAGSVDIVNATKNLNSHYKPGSDTIVLGIEKAPNKAWQDYRRTGTVYHELGHMYHFKKDLINYRNAQDDIAQAYAEAQKLVRGKKGKALWETMITHRYGGRPDPAGPFVESIVRFGSVTDVQWWQTADVLASLTRGRIGKGHEKKYWKGGAPMGEMEFFVHGIENVWLGNPYMETHMPELYRILVDLINKVGPKK